jgi:hypothetical protein
MSAALRSNWPRQPETLQLDVPIGPVLIGVLESGVGRECGAAGHVLFLAQQLRSKRPCSGRPTASYVSEC